IARLRRKLGAAHRHRIVTVRRVGYKYVPDQQKSSNAAPCGRP
ncbi:winged helix-turn-helix domain-containing protein, partial [Streptomyces sp. NPDC001920]